MKRNNHSIYMRKVITLSAIFFLIGLFSCKKDGELRPDFDNGGLSIHFNDSLSVITQLVEEDSIRTDLSLYYPLGLYNDPIFGPVSSSIYTQVSLTGVDVDLGAPTEKLDSIVLTLDYITLYGDTNTPMTVNVYELSEDLSSSTNYYSNMYTAHYPTPIGSKTFVPNLKDSITIAFDSSKKVAHLRIKLDHAFGNKIMNATNELANNTSFINFMKGLYITTADSVGNTTLTSGTGSIVSFNMNSSLSTVTIYYSDSLKYNFTINSASKKYSRFAHNFTGTDIEAHLNNSTNRDSTVSYIGSYARTKTKISFPNIKDLLKEGTVVVNKAELEITVENGTEGNFDFPIDQLTLLVIDENGTSVYPPDYFEGLTHYGGIYDQDSKTYKFNIARHIHDLLYENQTDYGMYLVANGSAVFANRSVIGSENNPNAKIKLNITYSKL